MSTAKSADIHPFRIDIPRAELDDLRDRLARTRFPADIPGTGWERGVPTAYLKGLVDHWRTGYDWRVHEAALNEFPQFTTWIDGQDIHFLHVRSPEPDALPLILTHGWPGSIAEFTRILGPLTDPRAHGGDPADAFHVVAPSIPGFGFSAPLRESGWNSRRVAAAWAELMRRLGYDRYVAQGGDLGASISRELGLVDPEHMVALHVNGGFSYPFIEDEAELATLTERERTKVATTQAFNTAYIQVQSTRPQTLAQGLTDSPAGQLAWILEKFKEWTDPAAELPEDAVDHDQLLTNVSIYWFTGTAGSAAQFYRETANDWGAERRYFPLPTGVAQFTTQDVSLRRDDERGHNIVHWAEYDRGGHFAAMEAPDLLVADVREFFRAFR